MDLIRHDGFPDDGEFHAADLEAGAIALPDAAFDVVAVVETIEHLDGPRRFVRALARLVQPGGWLIVTTPNQLSLVSLLCLALRDQFHAFQEGPRPLPGAPDGPAGDRPGPDRPRAGADRHQDPLHRSWQGPADRSALAPAAEGAAVQRQRPPGRPPLRVPGGLGGGLRWPGLHGTSSRASTRRGRAGSAITPHLAGGLARAGAEVHVWAPAAANEGPTPAVEGVVVHRLTGVWSRAGLARLGEALDAFAPPPPAPGPVHPAPGAARA